MIKLILHVGAETREYSFDKDEVIIGSSQDFADLLLSDETIEPAHLKIWKENEQYIVLNISNDPFMTLNELPFGKRLIHNEDILSNGSFKITFFSNTTSPLKPVVTSALYDTEIKLEQVLEKAIQKTSSSVPIITHPSYIESDYKEDFDIDELVRQVENLEKEKTYHFEKDSHGDHFENSPIKTNDFYLSDLEDEYEGWAPEKEDLSPHSNSLLNFLFSWKTILSLIFLTMGIFAIVASYFYIMHDNQRFEEELKAAVNVSDIAMALKFAQLHNIKPSKQNWSDPDFLKNSLSNIVIHNYPTLTKLDTHGQFTDTPYLLRIYTSMDFTRFLVIAQPVPDLWQWLIPKTSLVIDSAKMEIRKIDDLKPLNRLLVNPGSLDGIQAKEVSKLVSKGKLIYLNDLANHAKIPEFSPPKALALLRPGAENYIYNSPRYYQIGEAITAKALRLLENPGGSHELSRLKHEISMLAKMNSLVFYSAGIEQANEAQKALTSFAPQAKFLSAYITFDTNGEIANSHLLMNAKYTPKIRTLINENENDLEKEQQSDDNPPVVKEETPIEKESIEPEIIESIALPTKEIVEDKKEIEPHPIVIALNLLERKRVEKLDELLEKIRSELNNLKKIDVNKVASLSSEYNSQYNNWLESFKLEIAKLKNENPTLLTEDWKQLLEKSELAPFYTIYLKESKNAFILLSSEINDNMTLLQLKESLEKKIHWRNFDYIGIDEEQNTHKNKIRLTVIRTLNSILNTNNQLSLNKDELEKILEYGFISDIEEKNFYLNEFEPKLSTSPN